MPQKKWPPTVRVRKDGQAVIRVAGKDYYLGKYNTPAARERYAKLVADLAAGRPLAPKREGGPLTVSQAVWRWFESQKLTPEGRWFALRTLPCIPWGDRRVHHTTPVQAASWEDVRKVLRCCGRTVRDMLLVQWHTGMRSAELCRFNLPETDTRSVVWIYRPAQHKMSHRGQDRVIAIGRKAQAVLRPRLQHLDQDGHFFVTRQGGPYTSNSYARAVAIASQRAGVQGFHAYRLRHALKQRVARQFGLEAARAVLGQTSIQTTSLYASGQDLEHAADVARKIGCDTSQRTSPPAPERPGGRVVSGLRPGGVDVFFLANEMSVASMQLVDECRCDLADKYEEDIKIVPDDPPY
jgi:integrase